MFLGFYFNVQIIFMYFVYMFGVMLISSLYYTCLYSGEQKSQWLRILVFSRQKLLSRSSLKACCALDHIYYPIMFFIITIQCIGLILMGPNRSPQSDYLLPCLPLNHLGGYAIALYGFGIIFHYVHVPIILLCYLCS